MKIQLYIKNICCGRCIVEVKRIFEELSLPLLEVTLGEVILQKSIGDDVREKLMK